MAHPTARRAASLMLAVEALLVVAPPLVVAQVWLGAQLIGGAVRLRIPDVAAQGVTFVVGACLVPLLLVAAVGVARRSRGWAVTGLVAQLGVAAHIVIPLLRPYPTLARVPGGGALLGVAVVATTATLVVLLAGARPDASPGRSRGLNAAVWGAVAVVVLAGAVVGLRRSALPTYPFTFLLPAGEGDGRGTPVAATRVPQNPSLAPNPFNSLHNDAWATDSYAIRGPRDPRRAAVESLFTGGDCATIMFDSRGRLVTLCSTLREVDAYVVDPRTLAVLARERVGERSGGLTDFAGGGYAVLDVEDRIVFATGAGDIRWIAVRGTGSDVSLEPVLQLPVSSALLPGEKVTSVMPDWSGRLWFVGARGTVGVADPRTLAVTSLNLGGESIENSFAVTVDGAYVVTGAALYRLQWVDRGPPRIVWRERYDAGSRRKPGQTSTASGTTPTVFAGGALVAITDNADPRMHVVVMRTDAYTPQRTACTVPVFDDGHSATENSLVAVGSSLVVENNDGYDPPVTSTVGGATSRPGMARVDVGADGCRVAWSTPLPVPSVVSKASTADGLVYTYSKPASWWGGDGWYLTAVDAATGTVAWTRLAGGGLPFNNHYAGVALSGDGDLFVGTLYGVVVLRHG